MTEELFFQLLEKGESNSLDYKEHHYFSMSQSAASDKKDKDAEFIKDIISFANTVRNETSFILIGVKEDETTKRGLPIGINVFDRVDNSTLQSKIRSKVTPSVTFSCYPFHYKGLEFDIIEIPVLGYNQPIVSTFTKGEFLVKDEVYIRADSSNTKAQHSEIERIYSWFRSIPKSHVPLKINKFAIQSNDLTFDEETIQKLFGNEAAEDEDIERLKDYYFKNDTYQRVVANAPIRILVGHKGVGKSALFKIAKYEDLGQGLVSIILKPDDISTFGKDKNDFLETIKSWKDDLINIILKKTLSELGVRNVQLLPYNDLDSNLLDFISEYIEERVENGEIRPNKLPFANQFISKPLINIYIDDLDRGWIGGKVDISRISALLNAVRDLTQDNRGLQFRISLRSDVYYLVRTSDESTDKIGSSVIWYQWNQHQILVMLAKRIRTFLGKPTDEKFLLSATQGEVAQNLNAIIEPIFGGRGKWEHKNMHTVLLSVIRKRPRDLVKLLTLAARSANKRGSNKILTQDLISIFDEYSQDRIQDTINEYKSELPHIDRLIFGMKPDKKTRTTFESFYYDTSQLKQKIYNIILT